MGAHQLFFPLVSETNEHVLARTLQPLAVVGDESEEAVNVDIVFKVDGQYVSHIRPWPTLRLAIMAERWIED